MAGTTVKLDNTGTSVDTSNDSVVIVQNLETIPGGSALDVTGFTPEVINAGHLIIEQTVSGDLKPMPVTGNDYAALPAGHTYKGVLVASILKAKPSAAIMVRGTVNDAAFKNGTGLTTPAEAKTALVLIRFTKD
ncbi:MAG TPA: hypothetical protein VF677_11825 [Flavobacterium sp.]|jgi:hypothetical protein